MRGYVDDEDHPVAIMLDGVYEEAGFDVPLGVTDYNVVEYAMATCAGQATPPAEWGPWGELDPSVPADVVETFAAVVGRHAARTICSA